MMLLTMILRVSATCTVLASAGNPGNPCASYDEPNCGWNSMDCAWGATPTNCDYVEASPFPITTSLTFDSIASAEALIDLSSGWITTDASCSISSCVVKTTGCISPYTGSNVSLNGFVIEGNRNIFAGWSETVCVECTDSNGGIIQKDL